MLVSNFFSGVLLPRNFLATTILLIPKVQSPSSWAEFRPISLCNMVNKILTKLLTNRLSHLPSSIICLNQSGFASGKNIADNILQKQELVHDIDYTCKEGNMCVKLDMAKAYDRVHWEFLYSVLERMGFSAH